MVWGNGRIRISKLAKGQVRIVSSGSKIYSGGRSIELERLSLVQTIPMLKDYLIWVLVFLQRVALILIQHATLGLQTPNTYVNLTDSPSVDEILPGIAPYPTTFYGRIDFSWFDKDPRVYAYMFLLDFHDRLYRLILVDYDRVDFTYF